MAFFLINIITHLIHASLILIFFSPPRHYFFLLPPKGIERGKKIFFSWADVTLSLDLQIRVRGTSCPLLGEPCRSIIRFFFLTRVVRTCSKKKTITNLPATKFSVSGHPPTPQKDDDD